MQKQSKGVTLIALVVTIIILLILAGVSITILTGDNGLLTKSNSAVEKHSDGEIEEQIKLAYLEWKTSKLTGKIENAKDFIKNRLDSTLGNVDKVTINNTALMVFINKDGKDKIYYYSIEKGIVEQIEFALNSNNKKDSYVGYYADIEEDGIVDGIIFADLLAGSIKEKQEYGSVKYNITQVTEENSKKYYISKTEYDGVFGKNKIISPLEKDGEKRFYIMSLEDFTTESYVKFYWYKNAIGNINDYETVTLKEFGTGKENTNNMIERWKKGIIDNGGYGIQDNQDIWKHIQIQYNKGWFIPSVEEWAAFSNELGITKENHSSNYKLGGQYWSSSLLSNSLAYTPNYYWFNQATIDNNRVGLSNFVRLATTF